MVFRHTLVQSQRRTSQKSSLIGGGTRTPRVFGTGSKLILQADNDSDLNGPLLDEFSDAISAYIAGFDGEIKVLSIRELSG